MQTQINFISLDAVSEVEGEVVVRRAYAVFEGYLRIVKGEKVLHQSLQGSNVLQCMVFSELKLKTCLAETHTLLF